MDIKSMYLAEIEQWMKEHGQPAFRAKQVFQWMHQKYVASTEDMSNLPKALRAQMDEEGFVHIEAEMSQESKSDGTIKFLYRLSDGQMIETVFMRHNYGNSVCISSQAGCRMGCRFCASTIGGLVRNLTASEMLEQIYATSRITGERISHVVVMGTGEPFDNFDNLKKFIRLLTDENGLHISQRNVTVSTCGLVPRIYELAEENLQITLALSLHATTDEKRRKLMPIANKYSIDELMEACAYYHQKTGRRVTFEYSMVKGVNDSAEDAQQLTALAKRVGSHINLIPVNPIKERDFVAPDTHYVQVFKNKLEKNRINVTIRREMGRDIDGACGQLRKRHLDEMGGEDSSC